MTNRQLKKIKLKIHGMHCASCEILIERKFKKVAGVEKVSVNHASGKADLLCSYEPDIRELSQLVEQDGYSVSSWHDRNNNASHAAIQQNTADDYIQMGGIFLMIVALYYILRQFDFLPNFSIAERMNYGLIFLIGLFAAVSSCIAVVGGLLLALAAKHNELHPDLTGVQKFKPHIYFNLGRIAGYTLFGGIVGALGSVLTLSPQVNGYLMIIVSVIMLILGFQLLHLFPGLRRFTPKMPKFVSHKIHDLSAKETRGAPFTLGALTFFLPCGFTQALQLYVLATGDWKVGALTMMIFSLGTLPALLSLSAISSFARGAFQRHFLRFAGVLVVLVAVYNINNALVLAGYDLNPVSAFKSGQNAGQSDTSPVEIVDGKQVVKMTVSGLEYQPNRFTVVEGVPVEWQIDGRDAIGCGRVLVMPTLGLNKYLSPDGITTITFTPTKTGTIPFNCSMGMMTPGSGFTVVPNTEGIVGAVPGPESQIVASGCDPSVASCVTQKRTIEVSQGQGVYPRSIIVKKGVPVELTIDNKVALGGCMSVWVIPKFDVTISMEVGIVKSTFTPTETGVAYITCSMGSKMAEIIVQDQ